MKNTLSLIFTLTLIVSAGLGCSFVGHAEKNKDAQPEKTLKDQAVDVAVGDEKIGIPECDEVVDFFNHEITSADDDFVTKAVKKTALNQFKEQFRQAVEDNKTDKVQLA